VHCGGGGGDGGGALFKFFGSPFSAAVILNEINCHSNKTEPIMFSAKQKSCRVD
jgi:hypothetical protein